MGRWFPAALAVLVGAFAIGPADGAVAADRRRLCNEETFRLVYRPHAPVPHLEVYAGDGKRFRKRDRIVYVDAFRIEGGLVCGELSDFSRRFEQMRNKKVRLDQAALLTCHAGSLRSFSYAPYPRASTVPPTAFDAGQFHVTGGDRRILYAFFIPTHQNPSSPLIKYDGNVCTASRPPKRA
jgi:hypothetical protein